MRGVAAKRTDSLPSRVLLCRSGFEIEELLAEVLNSSLRESDRLLALRTMIAAGTDRCLAYIRGAFFRDVSPGVRSEALTYLAERNAFQCTREYIEIALEDSSEMVRVRATRLIGLLSTPAATRLLADRLGTGTRVERVAIIERLAVLLQECGEELLDLILRPERPVQAIADLARVLDHCNLPFCVEVLESLFEHPAPSVRNAALRPLLRRLGEDGWPVIERGLRDSASKVRAHTVQSLGTPAAGALHADLDRLRRALREAHTDSDPEVRSRTAAAVAKLGFEGAAGILGSLERDDDPRVERIARHARIELEKRRHPTGA
jgi:HEAT repeat protein